MNKYITILITLLVIICTSCQNKNQKTIPASQVEFDDYSFRIDSLIETNHPRKFNGVVLITKNGKTKYKKEYGFSDFENKVPISINDKFRIMSNSKQITAVLVLRQVQKGTISLQNTIRTYLPNFEKSWADTVTVHQLLNMSSGIVDVNKELIFTPGQGYRYSNPGYGILGQIIKKVTGKDYIQCAKEMFKQIGMNETYCYELNKENEGLINGYWLKDQKEEIVEFDSTRFTKETWDDFIPCGGIISTADDLNIWDSKLHGGKLLDSETYKLLVTPSNKGPHAAFDNDTIGYAYGIRVHDKHPVKHLGHGGRGFGFASIKFYVPEKDVDVIVWENLYSRDSNWMDGDIVYHFENEIRKIVLKSNLVK